MAFWKKSEDPWDQKPKPVGRPAPEEQGPEPKLLDQVQGWMEQRKERKAQESALPAPIPCPWCGNPMTAGELFACGQSMRMVWQEGRRKRFWEARDSEESAGLLNLGGCEDAWFCADCKKLVLDVDAAMKSRRPNYTWEKGRVVLEGEEDAP